MFIVSVAKLTGGPRGLGEQTKEELNLAVSDSAGWSAHGVRLRSRCHFHQRSHFILAQLN